MTASAASAARGNKNDQTVCGEVFYRREENGKWRFGTDGTVHRTVTFRLSLSACLFLSLDVRRLSRRVFMDDLCVAFLSGLALVSPVSLTVARTRGAVQAIGWP